MTKPVARTIAAVVAIGVVCCVVVMIVAVHPPDEDNRPEIGNVTPEGSPTVSGLPGDISRNATSNQVPEETPGAKNMTSKEVWERAQEIYASWYRSNTVERVLKEANMTPEEFPDDVIEELKNTAQFEDIIRTCEFDPQNKQIVIYASLTLNEEREKELSAVQGKQASGWTFNVVWEPYVPPFVRRALKEANMTPEELPDEVKEEMKNIMQSAEIGSIRTWELDPQNKQTAIYVYFIPKENDVDAIQGRQVGGWTFTVIHDLDYEEEREQVVAELLQLQKDHPELEITGFGVSSTEIEMWVSNRTPENEALNGTVMHNRTVQIYWSPVDYAIRMAREEAGW